MQRWHRPGSSGHIYCLLSLINVHVDGDHVRVDGEHVRVDGEHVRVDGE